MSEEWGFYGRDTELLAIDKIVSRGQWFFCSITGRRRIGKTTLIRRAISNVSDQPHFYFQVPDSDERGVVQAFQEAVEDFFTTIGVSQDVSLRAAQTMKTFQDMASFIAMMCEGHWIVTIDEFQYFHRAALSEFTSFLQAEVDQLRDTKKGGIFVLGSIHTEMTAILEDQSSPLFNRVTDRIHLEHWDFQTLFEMFHKQGVKKPENWLFLWSIFEGVPKFYRDCHDQNVLKDRADYRASTLQNLFFEGSSPLRDEAQNWFLRELRGGNDSILKMIANIGPCPLGVLKGEYERTGQTTGKQFGGYLTALVDRYQMIEKQNPVFAPKSGRKARYTISDNFLLAWLKAIQRNVNVARVQPVEKPVQRASEMLKIHEGFTFEKMTRLCVQEMSQKGVGDFELTDIVQGYWNKPDGSDIEIDLVALNEDSQTIRFGSCKRSQLKHSADALKKFETHIERFIKTPEGRRVAGWHIEKALYATQFDDACRADLSKKGYICWDIKNFQERLYPV